MRMLTDLDKMNPQARLWIYQADRPLTATEQQKALKELAVFLGQWAAHGSALRASGTIAKDHFLIICIDESFQMASGCSIDSSVHFVQALGDQLGVDFFQRTNLAFLIDEKVRLIALSELKEAVQAGTVSAETRFFDNTIQSKGQLENHWCKKAGETWLKRYFKAPLSV